MDELEQAKQRYQDLLPSMTAIQKREFRADLAKFSHNCVNILNEISKEEVVCRQRKHVTSRYNELITYYANAVDMLEKYVMFAHLSGG
jgi:hypothetical protein